MRIKRPALTLLLSAVAASFCLLTPSLAQIKADLTDPYLEREFDWAMFVDTRDLKQCLNYPGTKLNPLTRVRVSYRSFPRGSEKNYLPAKRYEELWYHRGHPVGLRRYQQLEIPSRYFGAIVVGPADDNLDKTERSVAIANTLVRLVLDLQFQEITTAVVLVPKNQYDQISEGFEHYRFYPNLDISDGRQLNIHVRSYPAYKDEYFYYKK